MRSYPVHLLRSWSTVVGYDSRRWSGQACTCGALRPGFKQQAQAHEVRRVGMQGSSLPRVRGPGATPRWHTSSRSSLSISVSVAQMLTCNRGRGRSATARSASVAAPVDTKAGILARPDFLCFISMVFLFVLSVQMNSVCSCEIKGPFVKYARAACTI